MLITGKISVVRALLYIVVQCAGAVAGTASLKSLLPEQFHNGLGHTTVAPELTALQGFGLEFFLGFILIFTVFGVCDGNKPGILFGHAPPGSIAMINFVCAKLIVVTL